MRLIESSPNISNELQTDFNAFLRATGTLELRKRPLPVPGVKDHSRYLVWMICKPCRRFSTKATENGGPRTGASSEELTGIMTSYVSVDLIKATHTHTQTQKI